MQVKTVMTPYVQYINSHQSLQEAAQLMRDLNIGFLPVIDNNQLVGALTDRDITINCVARGLSPQTAKVFDGMTRNAIVCTLNDNVTHAMQLMKSHQVRRLIVVDEKAEPIGILSLGDLSKKLDDADQVERVLEKISENRVH